MPPSWHDLMGAIFRPERPRLARCRAHTETFAAKMGRTAADRLLLLLDCRQRIEAARATVFAANDGVVGSTMTELEREWLELSRRDDSTPPVVELWSAIAPRRWADRLRWDPTGDLASDLRAAMTLASDPDGVERAEQAAQRLSTSLANWQTQLGTRTTWCVRKTPLVEMRAEVLLGAPLAAIHAAVGASYGGSALLARAFDVERDALDIALRTPALQTCEVLAADVAFAARVDFLWRACAVDGRVVADRVIAEKDNPVTPLFDLWLTGHALAAVDGQTMTLLAVEA